MKVAEIVKLAKEEKILIPVQSLTDKQFRSMMKRTDVELDERTDNFRVVK